MESLLQAVFPSPSPCSVNISEICLLGQLLGKGCYGGKRKANFKVDNAGSGGHSMFQAEHLWEPFYWRSLLCSTLMWSGTEHSFRLALVMGLLWSCQCTHCIDIASSRPLAGAQLQHGALWILGCNLRIRCLLYPSSFSLRPSWPIL